MVDPRTTRSAESPRPGRGFAKPHAVDRPPAPSGRVADAAVAELDLGDPQRAPRGDRGAPSVSGCHRADDDQPARHRAWTSGGAALQTVGLDAVVVSGRTSRIQPRIFRRAARDAATGRMFALTDPDACATSPASTVRRPRRGTGLRRQRRPPRCAAVPRAASRTPRRCADRARRRHRPDERAIHLPHEAVSLRSRTRAARPCSSSARRRCRARKRT